MLWVVLDTSPCLAAAVATTTSAPESFVLVVRVRVLVIPGIRVGVTGEVFLA